MTVLHSLRVRAHAFASIAPLLAAVAAPLAVLLDIPALTEPWRVTPSGTSVPSPTANLTLSALDLVFSFLANLFLVVRFSLSDKWWKLGTRVSVGFWFIKVCIAVANFIVTGILSQHSPNPHSEGFWCAVLSLLISTLVLLLLLFHFIIEVRGNIVVDTNDADMRVAGRTFMIQVTGFIFLIGISALIFSRIEHWTYLTSIYFFVTTFTTVGFGDYVATQTSTRILLFPLAVLGIAQLANMIGMIVSFFSDASAVRKAQARANLERERLEATGPKADLRSLNGEVDYLERLNDHQEWVEDMTSLAWSMAGFFLFWFVGAVIFSEIEGYDYGIGLYFCYVFFLSVGYGDYAPKTAAGKVVFVVYALLAVPVMASFAVQAITQIFGKISDRGALERRLREIEGVPGPDGSHGLVEHAAYVATHYDLFSTEVSRLGSLAEEERALNADEHLTHRVLEKASEMERHARRLLINHLEHGCNAQVLLKADRNVQLRDLRALTEDEHPEEDSEAKRAARSTHSDIEQLTRAMDDNDTMEAVRLFRESFAAMLAAGSQLKRLKGKERMIFERRKTLAERASTLDQERMSMDSNPDVQKQRKDAVKGTEGGADARLAAVVGGTHTGSG